MLGDFRAFPVNKCALLEVKYSLLEKYEVPPVKKAVPHERFGALNAEFDALIVK